MTDLVVLYEHPDWQKPLFAALERRGIRFEPFDLKRATFDPACVPEAKLYFNQASPSAYVRGNTRAVSFARALLRSLDQVSKRVLNGTRAFELELSKSAQIALMTRLGIRCPRTITFNDPGKLRRARLPFDFPALIKPEQGGSGARMHLASSIDDVGRLLAQDATLWEPDHLLLLQELVAYDEARGIVRLEIVGGELLYAMRVVSHGAFNLCPSPVCNPDDGSAGACEVPAKPVEFHPYPDVPVNIVEQALRIAREGGLDVAGIECIEAPNGEMVFYDINANSNLRPSIGHAFGFDPFERVVDFLERQL